MSAQPPGRKLVACDGQGRILLLEEPTPAPSPGTVLVQVKASLISAGTELWGIRARRENPRPDAAPMRLGYGNAGIVLATGEGVESIEPGMPVACMGSGYALHASHVVVPQNLAVPIPEGLDFEEAAFAHLAATALWAVRRAGIGLGWHVAVVGLGVVGQVAAQLARASGAHVAALDRLPGRLKTAAHCGADVALDCETADLAGALSAFSRGYGLDAVIVAFGGDASQVIESILPAMKTAPDGHRYGTIVIVGGARFAGEFPGEFGNIDIRSSSRPGPGYHDREWELGRDYPGAVVQWHTRRNLEECLLFAARGRLDLAALVSHRFPLAGAPEAYELLLDHPDRALGVILQP